MKILKKILIILLVLIIICINNFVYGEDINVDYYNPKDNIKSSDIDVIVGPAGFIMKAIQVIGIILGTVGIAMLGLRYILGSASEKAEFKETAWPYVFGIIFLFGSSGLLQLLAQIFN